MYPPSSESANHQAQYHDLISRQTDSPNYACIPERFQLGHPQNPLSRLEDVHPDRLCNLAGYSDSVRTHQARLATEAIKNDQSFAILSLDADQLKTANKVSHVFGDEYIRWLCGTGTQAINSLNLSCAHEVSRSATAADEISFLFINPSSEDLAKIRAALPKINQPVRLNIDQNTKFTFAISSGLIDSSDPKLKQDLQETQSFLKQHPDNIAHNFYNQVKDLSESKANQVKILHELMSLPLDQMTQIDSLPKFISFTTREFGGSRIGPGALNLILRLNSLVTLQEVARRQNPPKDLPDNLVFSPTDDQEVNSLIKSVISKFHQNFPPLVPTE